MKQRRRTQKRRGSAKKFKKYLQCKTRRGGATVKELVAGIEEAGKHNALPVVPVEVAAKLTAEQREDRVRRNPPPLPPNIQGYKPPVRDGLCWRVDPVDSALPPYYVDPGTGDSSLDPTDFPKYEKVGANFSCSSQLVAGGRRTHRRRKHTQRRR